MSNNSSSTNNNEKSTIASDLLNRQIDQQKILSLTERIENLSKENEILRQQQKKGEKDTHEFVAYFQKDLNKKDEKIASLTTQLMNEKVQHDLEITTLTKKHEKESKLLKQTSKDTAASLASRLKTAQDDLSKLEIFRDMKDVLEKKLASLQQALNKETHQHVESCSALERKFLEEKSRVQKDTERKIERIRQQSREEARNGLDADTRKIITDNKRMGEELRFQLQFTEELQREKHMFEEKLKLQTMEVNLHVEKEQEYAKQGQRQAKEIKQLQLKIKGLERSLSQIVHEFEKEKNMTLIKSQKELEDHSLDSDGLRRLLKLKNKELRNVRRLAQTILDHRTDVEQFFLESLSHVKGEIELEKKKQKEHAAEQFKDQMRKTRTHNRTRFPRIRNQESFPISQSKLPTSGSDKVDMRDLNWEDKERVLRLLFAKMNSLQGFMESNSPTSQSNGFSIVDEDNLMMKSSFMEAHPPDSLTCK